MCNNFNNKELKELDNAYREARLRTKRNKRAKVKRKKELKKFFREYYQETKRQESFVKNLWT